MRLLVIIYDCIIIKTQGVFQILAQSNFKIWSIILKTLQDK